MPLSAHEEAAFAAIVAQLGNPERRHLRRIMASLSVTVLFLVGAVVPLIHWPWAVYIAFSATFVVGIGVGWACISRRPLN